MRRDSQKQTWGKAITSSACQSDSPAPADSKHDSEAPVGPVLGTVCFYVLCNRHWFNRVCPGGASGDCLSTLRSFSDAGCADQRRPTPNHIGCPSQHRARVCRDFISRSPGQALYGAKSACAKRAATRYPPPRSPPSGIPRCPGGLYRGSIAQVWLRHEMFPSIGSSPGLLQNPIL